MATKQKDVPTMARNSNSRRIRKIFGNIHEISQMPNLIEVQRESYEQFLRSDPATGYVSGLEKTLRSVFPIQAHTTWLGKLSANSVWRVARRLWNSRGHGVSPAFLMIR